MVREKLGADHGVCYVIPSLHWRRWTFILEQETCYVTGFIQSGAITVMEQLEKGGEHPVIEATRGTDGVRTFLGFAQRVHVKVTEAADGYTVSWYDVRFWYDRRLPFGVDVKLDRAQNIVSERLGCKKKVWEGPYV